MITRKTLLLLVCLLLLYASWGTLFLANKIALQYYQPFILVGLRFVVAGAVLLAFTYFRREQSAITRSDIIYSLQNGFLLVVVSSGFLAKAQEVVSSGLAAILFGAAPIWLMLGQWLLWGGKKPTLIQFFGLFLGFSALICLNLHYGIQGSSSAWGLGLILLATFAWVYGTHFSLQHKGDTSLSMLRGSALILLLGGLETVIFALFLGERVDFMNIPLFGYISFMYLTFICSLLGYITYMWLLFNSRPIVAISYEYVTPAVAVILGAFFANETLDLIAILTSVCLIVSVFLITSHDRS